MKRFNQTRIQTKEIGKTNIRALSTSKSKRVYYAKIGTAIFAIIVLHFAAQFIFFNSKNLQGENTFAKTENEPIKRHSAEIKTEYKAINSDVVTTPAPPVIQREGKIAASPVAEKKKQPRETRAERLRRAEKLLTGV